jgi:hypothetical protein
LHHFVHDIRSQQFNVSDGGALQEKHTCVVSCDGDLGQVACNTDVNIIELEQAKKITSWKHNLVRMQVEQGQDLMNVPEMNHLARKDHYDQHTAARRNESITFNS